MCGHLCSYKAAWTTVTQECARPLGWGKSAAYQDYIKNFGPIGAQYRTVMVEVDAVLGERELSESSHCLTQAQTYSMAFLLGAEQKSHLKLQDLTLMSWHNGSVAICPL